VFILKNSKLIFATVSGLLLGFSLIHPWLWPLVFVGTVFTFYIVANSDTAKEAFKYGWVIGTFKILVSLIWFWSTYPMDWLGLKPGLLQILLVSLYWVPAGLTLGLGLGIAAWIYKKYCHHLSTPKLFLVVPLLWVAAEISGAVIFSIYTLGPGSYLTLGFSFGQTGYALVSIGLFRYVAIVGGVYLMSFFVALGALSVLILKRKTNLLLVAILTVLIIFVPVPKNNMNEAGTQVALIETSFPPNTKTASVPLFDRQQAYNDLVRYALVSESDVIILPEDSRFTGFFVNEEQVFSFISSITDRDVILIDSMRVEEEGKTVLRAYIYDTSNNTRYEFDKQYLVPQGEYIPWVYQGLIALLGPQDFTHKAVTDTVYEPGINQSDINLPKNIPPVLFCFESVTPFGVFKANRDTAPFVAHLVSHGWFKREPQILWHQLDAMLRTQALFNRVPIVQSANLAPAKIYWPDGSTEFPKIIAESGYWKLYQVQL